MFLETAQINSVKRKLSIVFIKPYPIVFSSDRFDQGLNESPGSVCYKIFQYRWAKTWNKILLKTHCTFLTLDILTLKGGLSFLKVKIYFYCPCIYIIIYAFSPLICFNGVIHLSNTFTKQLTFFKDYTLMLFIYKLVGFLSLLRLKLATFLKLQE